MELSNNAKTILAAINNGMITSKDIARHTGLTIQSVTGSFAVLKKHDYVVAQNGTFTLGAEGKKLFVVTTPKEDVKETVTTVGEAAPEVKPHRGRVVDVNSKAYKSVELYTKLHAEGKKRGEIITAFKTQLNLSSAAASTYIQNARRKLGLISQK